MSFGRLLGNLVGDLTRGNLSYGLSRLVRDAQYSASSAAQRAAQQAVDGAVSNFGSQGTDAGVDDDAAWVLLQAMIASAAADGEIDPDERQKIVDKAREAQLSSADMQKLEQEMQAPKTAEQVAALATGDEHKKLIYRLSIQAIVVDTEEEKDHLRRLGIALGLAYGDIVAIHQELGVTGL